MLVIMAATNELPTVLATVNLIATIQTVCVGILPCFGYSYNWLGDDTGTTTSHPLEGARLMGMAMERSTTRFGGSATRPPKTAPVVKWLGPPINCLQHSH